MRPRRSRAVRPRVTLLGRGLRARGASSPPLPPRGLKIVPPRSVRPRLCGLPPRPWLFCLPRVFARFRARGASSPPPCPLPSGGGWPRARPHAPCARHVAARALPRSSLRFCRRSASFRQPRGRNAPRAGMRAPAFSLRAQARLSRRASLRARHFCLPRVFAPIGHICPAAI